jgi:nucleotide-binding universal stress UspA family protein
MFDKIMICSDGSPCATRATAFGTAFASAFHSEVVLLDVFSLLYLDTAYLGAWAISIDPAQLQELSQQQHQAIVSRARPILDAAGVKYSALQEQGYPISSILNAADREHAGMIVMGGRGLSGLKSYLLGSVSDGVLHHAHTPLLIVHGEDIPVEPVTIKRVLFPSDGSPAAGLAAAVAVASAKQLGARLVVLNVVNGPVCLPDEGHEPIGDTDPEIVEARLLEIVDTQIKKLAFEAGISYTIRQEVGHPGEKILACAEDEHADLIVMGSRGFGGFKSMLLGSVSDTVAQHAKCPVLVVR